RTPAAMAANEALDKEIAGPDPASRLAASLRDERQQAQESLETLRRQAADEQAGAATEIVQRAISGAHTGTFRDVGALAHTLKSAGQHELAKDVDAIRHEDAVLVHIVHELLFT